MKKYNNDHISNWIICTFPQKLRLLLGTSCILMLVACEDLLEVDPPRSQVVREEVFRDDLTAEAAAKGMYGNMLGNTLHSLAGLSSDELYHPRAADVSALQFEENALLADNSDVLNLWVTMYQSVYAANALIEGLEASSGVTDGIRRQLRGEALFVRAFCHFYLVNLFGEVPVISTADYRVNAKVSREDTEVVYTQIEEDLLEAQQLLGEAYPSGEERVRPNRVVATALLARVYLFREDWSHAEAQATTLLEDVNYELVELEDITLANNAEAIWQLHSSSLTDNAATREGRIFDRPEFFYALTDYLTEVFEPGDMRKTTWVRLDDSSFYTSYKYQVGSSGVGHRQEYSTVFRLAEQYLIRAEARAQQGNIAGAQQDLNVIRNRAGLENTEATTQEELLDAILHERQVELFTELGHRWLDLKRTRRAVEVLSVLKPGFTKEDERYPIPQNELNANSNLNQNTGY